jgi:hypothetical protein
MAMATLTIMFPDNQGIELSVTFEQDKRLLTGVDVQSICLSGCKADFSEWLSESAIALIEQMIRRENDCFYLGRLAVEYENAA